MSDLTLCQPTKLFELLAQYGGKIVSTASLSPYMINCARASGRLYVDENSLGFTWEPEINELPTNEKELEWFEKWYPIAVEIPDELKSPSFLFDPNHPAQIRARLREQAKNN